MADSNTEFSVNWPVGDDSWKDVTGINGITRYRLYPNPSPINILYNYILEFTNSLNFDFRFYDESEDSYAVQTWANKDHEVKFSSDYPTIILVKAEEPGGIAYATPGTSSDLAEPSELPLLPETVPTPTAVAGPSVGVIAIASSAPIPSLSRERFDCRVQKARIRVEDKDGTAKGWISVQVEVSTSHLTTLPGGALHVKADKFNSGPTKSSIMNADGWSQLGIQWSSSPFNAKDSQE
ncbi:hypothetical protein M407DRAFT_24151 [Tulasnella calospora MUT 4182]|uniref:Uncharacterized protein n=1 Tax=Tulasnella calospora MUT 4182 TaxID=1051891 RepID=A0A0C3QIC5_9AGAM|nr:hypothetical protein M407DRAFT_24151 [Tulasnella calospora MUT 4182]